MHVKCLHVVSIPSQLPSDRSLYKSGLNDWQGSDLEKLHGLINGLINQAAEILSLWWWRHTGLFEARWTPGSDTFEGGNLESREPAPSGALGSNGRSPQAGCGMWIARGPKFKGVGEWPDVSGGGRLVPLGELAGGTVTE